MAPYLFLLPFFLIYATFLVYPVLAAFRLSFFESSGFGGDTFTGLDNYVRLAQDPRYLEALKNTTLYALASVFVLSPLALLVAVTIRSFVVPTAAFKSFYRIVFFLPFITSFVVIALMFNLVFNNDFGLLNNALSAVGLPTVDWLKNEQVSLLAIVMVGIWTFLGINALYFLTGLQNIPEEVIEAAAVDGANRLQTFWRITLPLLRPVILFVIVQATIFSYQLFEIPFLLTNGGPSDSTLTLAIYLYEVGFREFDRGYASAIGYSLAIIAIVLAAAQLLLARRFDR
ncbi:MAG: sugar ABC transporter permease [Rubrobacter sp.]|nr:sugar ABC transporter permease [Rubrobacter sp.]